MTTCYVCHEKDVREPYHSEERMIPGRVPTVSLTFDDEQFMATSKNPEAPTVPGQVKAKIVFCTAGCLGAFRKELTFDAKLRPEIIRGQIASINQQRQKEWKDSLCPYGFSHDPYLELCPKTRTIHDQTSMTSSEWWDERMREEPTSPNNYYIDWREEDITKSPVDLRNESDSEYKTPHQGLPYWE